MYAVIDHADLHHHVAACNERWKVVGHVLELMAIHSSMNGSNEHLVQLLKFSQQLHSRGTMPCYTPLH